MGHSNHSIFIWHNFCSRGHSARDDIKGYFIWGSIVSEVEVDLLTGEKKVNCLNTMSVWWKLLILNLPEGPPVWHLGWYWSLPESRNWHWPDRGCFYVWIGTLAPRGHHFWWEEWKNLELRHLVQYLCQKSSFIYVHHEFIILGITSHQPVLTFLKILGSACTSGTKILEEEFLDPRPQVIREFNTTIGEASRNVFSRWTSNSHGCQYCFGNSKCHSRWQKACLERYQW